MARRVPVAERPAIPAVDIAPGIVGVELAATDGCGSRFDAKRVVAFFALAYALSSVHVGSASTDAAALPAVIAALQARGYGFVLAAALV